MKKPTIYIAGKVTGLPENEVAVKFATAARILRNIRMLPINPIELVNNPRERWWLAMRKCIAALMTVDAVYALPDTGKSRGAMIELFLCRVVRIPVFRKYDDLLKHFGMYSKRLCMHPFERQVMITVDAVCNVSTDQLICQDCNAVLAEQIEV